MASGGNPLLQNSSSEIEKKAILNMEGNDECADCGQTSKPLRKLAIRGFIQSFSVSDPEWASINHGCVLCIECSGIHRKMGAHVSRIRSLTLDEWRYCIIVGKPVLRTVAIHHVNFFNRVS